MSPVYGLLIGVAGVLYFGPVFFKWTLIALAALFAYIVIGLIHAWIDGR